MMRMPYPADANASCAVQATSVSLGLVESHDQRRSERRLRLGFGVLILAILVATVVSFGVAARRWWLPPLASEQGRAVDQVIYTLFAVSIPFFAAAQFFIAFPLLRSRARVSGRRFTPPPLTGCRASRRSSRS